MNYNHWHQTLSFYCQKRLTVLKVNQESLTPFQNQMRTILKCDTAIGLKAGNFLQRSKRLPPKCVHVQHIWFVLVPWIGLLGFLVLFTTCISYVVNVDFYDFLQKFEEPCSCAYVTFPRHCQPVINPKSSLSLHQVRHRQNLETCISGRFSRQDLQKQI